MSDQTLTNVEPSRGNQLAPECTQSVVAERRTRMRVRGFLASLRATRDAIDAARARAAASHTSMEMFSTGHDKLAGRCLRG